jgi:hypothetical protein
MKIKYFKNFDDFMYNPKIYETEKEKAERIRKEREKKLERIFKENKKDI